MTAPPGGSLQQDSRTDVPTLSLLVVCRSYPPVIGGSEIETQRVCGELLRRGHSVEVVCCGGEPMPPDHQWVDSHGVPVTHFGRGAGRLGDYGYALGVLRTLLAGRRRYDLVYFVMPGIHVAFGVPLAKLLKLPVVMKFSGSNEIRKLPKTWVGRCEILFLRRWADRILLLNAGMLGEAMEVSMDRRRVSWIPNPADMTVFSPSAPAERRRLRTVLGLSPEVPTAVYLGRLAPEKELLTLLEAFRDVTSQIPEAMLLLVGDGPERDRLTKKAHALGLGRHVRITGMVDPGTVHQWLRASDVFVLVSSLEGFSVSLLEAMAVGMPLVASDIPANRQLVEQETTGLLVRLGDEKAIATALVRLFRDQALATRLGAAAREKVAANFSVDKVAETYERLFAEVASRI